MECTSWLRACVAGAAIVCGFTAAIAEDGGATAKVKVVAPPTMANADALLTALETADNSLETLQCSLVYDKRFSLQDDQHIRQGRLYYATEKGPKGARPKRTFAVIFDTLILDGAARPEQLALIFDGEWLVEKREADKEWIARQIAPPDAPIDPLRLGEGPLPIPIGQPKAEILARYDATLLPYDDGFQNAVQEDMIYRDFVSGCWQLLLMPKADAPDDERFQEIRLWYAPDAEGRILPRMAFTIDRKGDESFVQLIGTKVNEPIPDGKIDMAAPDEKDGWVIQRQLLDQAEQPADKE